MSAFALGAPLAGLAQIVELVTRVPPSMEVQAAGGTVSGDRRTSSDDGRYVVFVSSSSRVVAGQVDANSSQDVFRWDRLTGTVILVSRAFGTATAAGSNSCDSVVSISADGRFVVYASYSSDLVATDTNSAKDVFLFDAVAATTTLVSRNAAATNSGNLDSANPAISADGNFILFSSRATNLVSGQFDANGAADLFLYDRVAGTTKLVSRTAGSATTTTAGGVVDGPRFGLSADGRYVAYLSSATTLVTGQVDTNAAVDVFLFDAIAGTNTLVSHAAASASTAASAASGNPKISADGNYVAFESEATDLMAGVTDTNGAADLFLYSRAAGTSVLVSHRSDAATTAGDGRSNNSENAISLSADGRYLAYVSYASNLVAGQVEFYAEFLGPAASPDVFLFDRTTNTSVLVNRADGTTASTPNGFQDSYRPSLSADGRFVAYQTNASNIVAGFIEGGDSSRAKAYLFDASTGTTALVSRAAGTTNRSPDALDSTYPQVSGDGAYVTFNSGGRNLLSGPFDFNEVVDVFQLNRVAGTTTLVSRLAAGNGGLTAPGSMSAETSISGDGRYVAFSSNSRNLVPGLIADGNNRQVFRWDRTTGLVILVSRAAGTTTTACDGHAEIPWISNDGRYVAYEAYNSTNLVLGQTSSSPYLRAVFLFDAQTGTTTLVSHVAGAPANTGDADSRGAGISADGRYVFYYTQSSQGIAGLSNPGFQYNILRWDRQTDTAFLVSHAAGSALTSGNNHANVPLALSSDGRFVAFSSLATNLVAGQTDTNSAYDVFLRDCQTDTLTLVSRTVASATATANAGGSVYVPGRVSDDGRYVAYYSGASDLIAGFAGLTGNLFLFDAVAGTSTLVTHVAGAASTAVGQAGDFGLSADGRFVVYRSAANNLVTGQVDANSADDLFVFDRLSGASTLVSRAAGTAATTGNYGLGGNTGYALPLSRDGRYVAFSSVASNYVVGVTPTPSNDWDVYVADLQTGVISLASRTLGGGLAEAGGAATVKLVAADAPVVLFSSAATSLMTGNFAALGAEQLYLFEADLLPPTVAVSAPSASSTSGASVTYTLTYTDATAISLSPSHVVLNSTGGASAAVAVTGTGTTTRTVTLSAFTGTGTVGISVLAGSAADANSNPAPTAGPSAPISVTTTPATIGTLPATLVTATAGGSATLSVVASSPNAGTLTYQWRKFGQPITGNASATTATLTLSGLTMFDVGYYDVQVFNNGSPVVPPASRVTVAPNANLPAVLTGASPATFPALFEWEGGYLDSLQRGADGRVYLSGYFSSLGGVPRPGLARLNSDGSLDAAWTPAFADDNVYAFAVQPDGKVLLGGAFDQIGGFAFPRLARLNADGTVDRGFNPALSFGYNDVYAILLQPDGKIIAGGQGFSSGRHLVRLNADGTLDGTFNLGSGFDGDVREMVRQSDGKILVGGDFNTYNATPVGRIARLNADGTLDTGFIAGTGFNNGVRTIAVQADGKIVVGGNFTSYNGTPRNRLARLDPVTAASDVTFDLGAGCNDDVEQLQIQADGKIVVVGRFATFNGMPVGNVARLNPGGSLDITGFQSGLGFNNGVQGLVQLANGKLLVRTDASKFDGVPIEGLVRLEANGMLDPVAPPVIREPAYVYAIAPAPGGKWIVGGDFDTVNGVARNSLARLNADYSLDTTFSIGTGFNNEVDAVAVQPDGRVIAVGYFTTFDGLPANRLVRLNPDGTRDAGFGIGTGFDRGAEALALQADGKIVVGGDFYAYNGVARNRLVRLNSDGGLDLSFLQSGSGFNSYISTVLTLPDGDLLVAGSFTSYGATPAGRLIRLNGDGSADAGFAVGPGFDQRVNSLALQPDGRLLVCGYFQNYNGAATGRLTRLNTDGTRDSSFAQTYFTSEVTRLVQQADGRIVAGGWFWDYGATSPYIEVRGLARLNADGTFDANFRVPGSDLEYDGVYALQLTGNGGLLLGGGLQYFPGRVAAGLALLEAAPVPAITTPPATQVAVAGANVSFSVAASGGSLAYQWLKDGLPLVGATGATLTLPSVQAVDAASYTVILSNAFGKVTSAPALLTGAGAAPTITVAPVSTTLLTGATGSLSVTATGATSYQWRKFGAPLAGATNASLTFSPAALGDAGFYDVTAYNGLSFTRAAPVRLSVLPALAVDNPLRGNPAFPPSFETSYGYARQVLVQPDGKYYLAGYFSSVNGAPRAGLVRCLADGTIDPGFAPVATQDELEMVALARQSDGRLVVAYGGEGGTRALRRLNADGTIDATFNVGTGFDSDITALAVQTVGAVERIVVAGYFTSYNGSPCSARIARLELNGTLDPTFNTNAGTGFNATVRTLTVHPDGSLYVGGSFNQFNSQAVPYFTRLNANGTHAPLTGITAGPNGSVATILILPDSRLILGGDFTTYNGTSAARIVGLNADGSVDGSFITGTGFNYTVKRLLRQADGKVIAAGGFQSYNGIATGSLVRLTASGSYDATLAIVTGGESYGVEDAAILPDGDVAAVGYFQSFNGALRWGFARLNTDGSLDSAQIQRWGIPGGSVTTILPAPDGKWLVAGEFATVSGVPSRNFARLNADGTVDSAFAAAGGLSYGEVRAVAVQGDGRILVGGYFSNYYLGATPIAAGNFVRLNADGTLNTSFALGTGFNGSVNAVAVQSDGRILVGGDFSTANGVERRKLARLLPDGTLDGSFVAGPYFSSSVYALAVQVDGKILVGGYLESFSQGTVGNLVRLNADGSIDPTFFVGTGITGGDVKQILLQPDGRILICGGFYTVNGVPRAGLARLNADGSLDSTFAPGTGFDGSVFAMALQADNKVVVAGGFYQYNGVARSGLARLLADGSLDPTFGGTGTEYLQSTWAVAVRPDGRVLLGGNQLQVGSFKRYGLMLLERLEVLIANVTPAIVKAGDTIAISGSLFTGATAVRINGVDAASYTVVSDSLITAVVPAAATSGPISITIPTGTFSSSPLTLGVITRDLLALTSRATLAAGGSMAASFAIEGPLPKQVLIRGLGPVLTGAPFGFSGVLADPRLLVTDAVGATVGANDDWGSSPSALATAAAAVGAVPLPDGGKDAAVLLTLSPGAYTAQLDGVGGTGGKTMLEVYDADAGGGASSHLVMLTTRAPAGSADAMLITGFVVGGTAPKKFLVRALGDSLAGFRSSDTGLLIDPEIEIFQGATQVAHNDDWQSRDVGDLATVPALVDAAAAVGARPLGASLDAANLLTLSPGAYTVRVHPRGVGAPGETLLEIFEVDASRLSTFGPVITFVPKPQRALLNGQASFGVNVVAKPAGAVTYQWRKNTVALTNGTNGAGTSVAGATGPVLTLTNVHPADVGTYDVVVANGVGGSVVSPARGLSILPDFHSADSNLDGRIDLTELTRVIQIYNYRNGAVRTGEYRTQAGTEDGFALGAGAIATHHSADSNRDGKIDAVELLRVIELFNYVAGTLRTGQYHAAVGTDDGFAPGPPVPL